MKKIIAAFDGLKFSRSTKEYAVYLAKNSNAHLVGVFLDDFTYHGYKIYELLDDDGVSLKKREELETKDKEKRDNAVSDFETACREAGLSYSVHHDKSFAIQELLHESIYADLLVIDANETLTHYSESLPTRFTRDLLADVQCPVFLVPNKYRAIEKIALLYDGEPSSVYAVKMFSYLFPALRSLEAEVISVKDQKQSLHLPDNKLMKEFMKRHYPAASYIVLKGLPEDEITMLLKKRKINILVVLGAYRRSRVSRWFRESMADVLLKDLKYPLFIAHNK